MSTPIPPLGLIEGFYGTPWTFEQRLAQIDFLAQAGYRHYCYAPKDDVYLRDQWTHAYPLALTEHLAQVADRCAKHGMTFGVGLSPKELYLSFDDGARQALREKWAWMRELGVHTLSLLFDDMRGDFPDLAQQQIRIAHWVADLGPQALWLCPTYYSDDAVLDRVFGQRPPNYLRELGRGLDPIIQVYWTGEAVCSAAISASHIRRVARQLRRPPVLWDNYPVNDGPRMSQHLHIRAFTGRDPALAAHVHAHMVNPALQPVLSQIPLLSLVQSYKTGSRYAHGSVFRQAARRVCGPDLGRQLWRDLSLLQDMGLNRLKPDTCERLKTCYSAYSHPAAAEVLAWLVSRD